MRTRRSPRNQELLWRYLSGKPPEITPVVSHLCGNCAHYPKHGRNRGKCAITGKMVRVSFTCSSFAVRKT